MPRTDDLRIRELKELTPPSHLIREFSVSDKAATVVADSRNALHRILHGQDDRLMVVIGPCSIHDTKAAMEYAHRLAAERERFAPELEIVMRVYFEKPRTTVGWKGLINDPYMDNSFRINDGLRMARELLLRHQRAGPAGRHRIPRRDQPAVRGRPDQLGRDRRPHHRVAGASRTGVRPVLPGRLQERHRRQYQDRGRCDQGRVAAAPFPVGDQGRPLGHRVDRRQRGLPHHPARRQGAEL